MAKETPGQRARRLIQEAQTLLDDPVYAEYHDRLRVAIENMEAELAWWRELASILDDYRV